MAEQPQMTYRYRGHVAPSAEVSRPVSVRRHAPSATDSTGTTQPATATLDIFDVIDSYGGWWGISARDVDAALAQVGDVDTLYVRINSPGGEATEGVAIANLFRAHPAEVRVTVYGMAASAASLIAVAGDVVSMAPGALLMIHDASNFAYGPASDLRKEAAVLDAISDSYAGIYAAKAGGRPDAWRALMRETTWYGADAAVTAKLADQVGLDPLLPGNLPAVEEDTGDDATVIEIDIELNPAARAAARRFDLSLLPKAPAALAAPQTPAEPPVAPSTNTKEADTMSDTLIQGLRERLGVTDETIDEAGLLAALDESLAEHAEPTAPAASADAAQEIAILRRELGTTQAKLGQLVKAREADETAAKATAKAALFAKAFAAGKVGGPGDEDRAQLEADYDEAPAVVERVLAGRAEGSRFPVKLAGYGDTDPNASADPAAGDNYWFAGVRTPAMTNAGD